ncbi:MAG: DUF885 domain-containing protein [Betaproteobacteria bacterium]|nr:DUF885 domain-containing protein [Betaproteobacteria bacterium]
MPIKPTMFLNAAAAICLAACVALPATESVPVPSKAAESREFTAYTDALLDEFWQEFPEFAFRAGHYKFADRMMVPDQARREGNRAFYTRHLARLNAFDMRTLSESQRVDWVLIKNRLESSLWSQDTFRAWQWQPSSYNVGGNLGTLLTREYAPIDTRLRHFMTKLERVPAYYRAAMTNIANPTLEHTELAIIQNRGALNGLGTDLTKRVQASGLSADEKALFGQRLADARSAVEGYVAYLTDLQGKLKKDGARSFRIGADLYEQKFRFDIQSGLSAAELHKLAMAEKAKHHDAMEKLARQLWPKYKGHAPVPADRLALIRGVLDELAKRHTTAGRFESTIREQIPALEEFVREKDLLDQDHTRTLKVRTMPAYMQGTGAGASISAPGPFDATAETWYNVEPLDKLSPEDAESFLREYNDWMLQILNIHEAIPGHYTQLMHANKSPSKIKTLFGNGAMIEGWAVFSELVMLEAGYGDHAPEMWLTWMKWNLRSVVNTLIDYQIQTQNMSRDAALDMMIREAFQQQKEATEKWRRATFSQVQLTSYFSGYAEIRALRERERARLGKDFTVKGFNNKFLSYGNAPVRYIAELMAKEPRY